jgi:hypothetical protein
MPLVVLHTYDTAEQAAEKLAFKVIAIARRSAGADRA